MTWDADRGLELARMDAAAIAARQEELLRRHVQHCAQHSPFYRTMLRDLAIEPGEIRTLADLARLPLTEKRHLEECHADFLAVAQDEVTDVCLTSGTTGKPIAMLQSNADLERLAYNEEISFRGVGITSSDRVLVAAAIDRCFMAGLAYFMGLTRIGATVIRGGSSSTALLVELIKNCRPSAIIAVPTLLLALAKKLEQEGLSPAEVGVTRLICIGEPVRTPDFALSPLGERLFQAWGCQIFGTYASTEMATSFTDCEAGLGGHLHPDLIAVEIVDEEGHPVPDGTPGEVIATPLGVSAMPLLRFRTGDIATLHREPCACGRNTPRIGPVVGRKSQMLKYRGTTVYPPAIATVLQGMSGVQGFYIEAESEFALSDCIRVVVGAADPSLTAAQVAKKIAAAIRVSPEVVLVSPEEVLRVTVQEDKRKPVLFFDRRTPPA
ncbi:phenylacetate--CoA ligase family protein [Geomonas anaerohicana]|uniref:AMP-binding protein n=1 Tax=Geomonas anaerohicana TaxID=2798583 RepID=A0ABS0Y8V9_9BACT|nr:AMP-binding protein [Geomonas anaerohicana]MBJ6748734.1 AMP-binding protein [Geomonas anaerohicana]